MKTYEEWKWLKKTINSFRDINTSVKKEKQLDIKKQQEIQKDIADTPKEKDIEPVKIGNIELETKEEWWLEYYEQYGDIEGWTKEMYNLNQEHKTFSVQFIKDDINKYTSDPVWKDWGLKSIKVVCHFDMRRNDQSNPYIYFQLGQEKDGKELSNYLILNNVYDGDEQIHTTLYHNVSDMNIDLRSNIYGDIRRVNSDLEGVAKETKDNLIWLTKQKEEIVKAYRRVKVVNNVIKENEFMLNEISNAIDSNVITNEMVEEESKKIDDIYYSNENGNILISIPALKNDIGRNFYATYDSIAIGIPKRISYKIVIDTGQENDFSKNKFIMSSPLSTLFADITEIKDRVSQIDDLQVSVQIGKMNDMYEYDSRCVIITIN